MHVLKKAYIGQEVRSRLILLKLTVKGLLQAENIKWQPENEEDVLCIPSERARAFRRNMQEMFKMHEFPENGEMRGWKGQICIFNN